MPIVSTGLGFELTFVPRRPRSRWQEWRNIKDAIVVAEAFNARLWTDPRMTALSTEMGGTVPSLIWAKPDIFRSVLLSPDPQPHDSYCIEVNNLPFKASTVVLPSYYSDTVATTHGALQAVYDTAAALDLHPYIERRRRDGTLLQSPTGGGHIHVGIDFWGEGGRYLPRLYHLEKALCLDFCNNPWIKWLLSQWFDDTNSSVAMDLAAVRQMTSALRRGTSRHQATSYAHDAALKCHALKQRCASTGKPQRPTYEFRFLDMPRTVDELRLQAAFIARWVGKRVQEVEVLEDDPGLDARMKVWSKRTAYTLTPGHYRRLCKDLPFARRQIVRFCEGIDLDPEPLLAVWWERSYLPRMRHGKAV